MRTEHRPGGRPRGDRLDRLLAQGDGSPGDPADVPPGLLAQQVDDTQDWEAELDGRPARGRHRCAGVPLLSVPESLRSSELTVGTRAVRGLLVLVVAACLALGGRWLWTEHVAVATPPVRVLPGEALPGVDESATPAGPAAGVEGAEGSSAAGEEQHDHAAGDADAEAHAASHEQTAGSDDLVVHVTGAVAEPGVVTVPAGSRVVDAVRAVGGVTGEADQSTLNLARPLVDGEQVWVGRPGETPPVAPGPLTGGGASPGSGGSTAGTAALLDLNAATQADLEELPGIGPVTAGHILAWRDEHGRFSTVDELLEVSGIGERTLAQLEPHVVVGG